MTSTPVQAPKPHTKWPAAIGLGAAVSLILAIVVLAFMWPGKTSTPHNLPVSLAGPAAATQPLQQQIESQGVIDFVAAKDHDQALEQIQNRETYGAIVLASPGQAPEVLTASAGNAAATQMLSGLATGLQAQLSQQAAQAGADPASVKVEVTDVVPLSDDDPNGAGLASSAFPLAMGGMIGGILISLLVAGPVRRLAALGGFAVASGLVVALIMQTWFGYLQGSFWSNALAMGLTMLATGAFITGCTSLIGRAGIALGSVTTLFIGNPLSGATAPWQFLPEPWGIIGQYMVPGASGSLVRSLSYFPDASNAQQWWTLAAWAALGITLTLVGHFRSQAAMRTGQAMLEHEPAHAA